MNDDEESPRQDDRDVSDRIAQPVTRITGPIVLIALGLILLLSQNGILTLQGNWWAIFIALPALALLYAAYAAYQHDGRMSVEAGNSLSGAVIVGMIAVLAALGQLELLVPLLLIAIGVLVALGLRQPGRSRHRRSAIGK